MSDKINIKDCINTLKIELFDILRDEEQLLMILKQHRQIKRQKLIELHNLEKELKNT